MEEVEKEERVEKVEEEEEVEKEEEMEEEKEGGNKAHYIIRKNDIGI